MSEICPVSSPIATCGVSSRCELEDAQAGEPNPDEAAQREIGECDAKLCQHRAAPPRRSSFPIPSRSWDAGVHCWRAPFAGLPALRGWS